MMGSSSIVVLPLFVLLALAAVSECTYIPQVFYVGGEGGWVVNPPVKYDQWAANNTFRVEDKLVFKYDKKDSVLQVGKENYDTCNKRHYLKRQDSGESVVELKQPGVYYFISGEGSHCTQGQKLSVTVQPADGSSSAPSPSPRAPVTAPAPAPEISRSSVGNVSGELLVAVAVAAVGSFLW